MAPHRYVLTDNYWKMRITHPYSMLAACDHLAASCGQAPVGEAGEVLFPGDLAEQSDQVIGTMDRILADAGLSRGDLERTVIYTSETDSHRLQHCLERFTAQAPESSTVYLVGLPPLFYDGLLVEVDYYAIPGRALDQNLHSFAIRIDIDPRATSLTESWDRLARAAIDQHLQRTALQGANIVKLSCYAPCREISFWESLSRQRLNWFAGNIPAMSDVITEPLAGAGQLILDVTCTDSCWAADTRPVGRVLDRGHPEAVRSGPLLFTSSLHIDPERHAESPSVTEEVNLIMGRHGELLNMEGMDFKDVIKSTTFYEGAGSPQALHENMSARNTCYQVPGPGSTGLPVAAFPYPRARTSVELIVARQ